MTHSSPSAARKHHRIRARRSLQHLTLALALTCAPLVHAAGTSKATGTAPRTAEIEWIDLSDYDHAQASSATGQSFNIDLLDGRKLAFVLKHVNAEPPQTAPTIPTPSYGVAPLPISSISSFGNAGYTGIAGEPAIFGRRQGSVEISDIRLTDADGHRFAFEWVAADAETTGHSRTRQEFLEFVSNGAAWSQIASLTRNDGTPNPGTLTLTGDTARVEVEAITTPEGGAYVVGSINPTNVKFVYGSDDPGAPGTGASREAAAFGIIPSATMIDPINVPANHPLALLAGALALGWLARRKLRRA